MTLKELEQQIVSEAVKAFREKLKSILDMVDSGGFVLSEDSKIYIKDETSMVLTDQLNQAMRKVAEETVEQVEGNPDYPRWLNHNSEEGK